MGISYLSKSYDKAHNKTVKHADRIYQGCSKISHDIPKDAVISYLILTFSIVSLLRSLPLFSLCFQIVIGNTNLSIRTE